MDRETLRRLLAIVALIAALASYALGAPPLAAAVVLLCVAALI